MIADDFRKEMGRNTDIEVSVWYERGATFAYVLGGKKQPVGLWSTGDLYRFPDGSEALVVADRVV